MTERRGTRMQSLQIKFAWTQSCLGGELSAWKVLNMENCLKKAVIEIMGKLKSHRQNMEQYLRNVIYYQIVKCDTQYFWITGIVYIKRKKFHLLNKPRISYERAIKFKKINLKKLDLHQ